MRVFLLRRRVALSLALVYFAAFAAAATDSAVPGRILIRAGHILDVHNGKETADQTIVVTGDLITAISPTNDTPAQPQDQEVDLRGMTVMPGLIDVHTHLTMDSNFDPYRVVDQCRQERADRRA
jgi:imidazolonepropionase-like amidohydrolase